MAFHFPHGVVLSQWTPATTGKGYAITPGLAPLADYQDDVNVISGLQQNSWGKGPGGGHAQGMPCFATAVAGISSGAGGPSFDQVLGAELGSATKFRTLVGHREQADGASEGATSAHMNNISVERPRHTCAGGPRSPALLLDAGLGDFSGAKHDADRAHARGTRGDRPQKERARSRDGRAHWPRKPGWSVDRARLDSHLTALREVERIATAAPSTTMSAACAAPPTPTADEVMSYDLRSKIYLRVFALAFRCDLTRYASFALSNGYDSREYPEISTGDHHGITHNGKYGPNPPNIEMKFVTYFAGLLAYLLKELKSTSEGGGTLLDNASSTMEARWRRVAHCDVDARVLAGKAGR